MGRKKSKSYTYRVNLVDDYKRKSKDELVEEVVDTRIELEKLKRKLRRYENPHTPPSKDSRKSETSFISQTGLAVGKTTGYKGATRKQKKPTDFIELLTRLNLPLGYTDQENIPQSGKLVAPLYWVLKEMARGEILTAHAARSRQDNKLTRNIVRTLLKSPEPLVLLGDPGSGKSVTLRQIGLKLADWMQRSIQTT